MSQDTSTPSNEQEPTQKNTLSESEELSRLRVIFYSILIIITFIILILNFTWFHPIASVIVIAVVILFLYFFNDLDDEETNDAAEIAKK